VIDILRKRRAFSWEKGLTNDDLAEALARPMPKEETGPERGTWLEAKDRFLGRLRKARENSRVWENWKASSTKGKPPQPVLYGYSQSVAYLGAKQAVVHWFIPSGAAEAQKEAQRMEAEAA
jgi:hypothetical protein